TASSSRPSSRLMTRPLPRSTPFPYTTLFRSDRRAGQHPALVGATQLCLPPPTQRSPRRIAMKKLSALCAAVLATGLAASVPAAAQQTLTVVSFGGAYGAAQQVHQINPYMEATGNKVLFENYTGGVAEIKAQVESGNIQWDVVDIETIDLERACSEGLLEVMPRDILKAAPDGTPAEQDFIPDALVNECGVGEIVWSTVFAYNHDTLKGDKPTTMQDFFDLKKFPGKRA